MSHVTDIILSTAIEDGGEPPILHTANQINDYLKTEYGRSLKKVDQHGGGNKALQCDLFIGAINNLNIKKLVSLFDSLSWEYPESAQLMLKDEREDKFRIYEP